MKVRIFKCLWPLSLLCLIMLAVGCGGKDDQGQITGEVPSEKISERDIKEFDEEVQTLIMRGQEFISVEDTPFDKIAQALEEEKITKAESVILTFTAAFDADNLPKEYEAPIPERLPDGILMEAEWWLEENWASLTEKEKEALEPFHVPPTDPRSFFHPDYQNKRKGNLGGFQLIPLAHASPVLPTNVEVLVWNNPRRVVYLAYYDDGTPLSKQRALWVEESVQKAWVMFKELLGFMPYHDVHVALVPMGRIHGSAKIMQFGPTERACSIKVNNNLDERHTKAAASHELFHAFQFEIPLDSWNNDAQIWMVEATATWSEHYVWPDYNTEWYNLGSFFYNLNKHMVAHDKKREYATYMWYLFLTQNIGTEIVKKNLHDVHQMDGRLVVSTTDYFDTLFAEFALWNWNQDPELRYQDAPEFPTGVIMVPKMIPPKQSMYPNGPSYRSMVHRKNREDHVQITLNSFSMVYRMHAIKDEIKKLEFKFEKKGDSLHKRQALIKIGDIWHWEDWTDTIERKFCRTRDEERVSAVVLIASNADHNKQATYGLDYDVVTKGECIPEWRGTIKWSWQYSTTHEFPPIPATEQYNERSYMIANETLVYDEDEGEFLIKNQFITYYYRTSSETNYRQEYGMQFDKKEQIYKGSTSSSWTIDEKHPYQSDAPTRLLRDDDNPLLFLVDVDEHEWGKGWITVTDKRISRRRAFPLEGIATPTPGTYDQTEIDIDQTDRFRHEPNDVEVLMSEDRKQIKAVIKQKSGSERADYDITIEINYSFK